MGNPFGDHVDVFVVRHEVGDVYRMVSIDDRFLPTPDDIQAIVRVCNEPLVYRFLFRERIGGRPYVEQDARDFLAWAREGWSSGEQMFFLLLDPLGEIAAAIDVGGLDESRSARIGYWCSSYHGGLMTNTVERLAELALEAGYFKFVAFVEAENVRSISVLKRTGFIHVGSEEQPILFMDRPVGVTVKFRRYERAL
jgi:RimJ/RimL family protein N-acetyltransferase